MIEQVSTQVAVGQQSTMGPFASQVSFFEHTDFVDLDPFNLLDDVWHGSSHFTSLQVSTVSSSILVHFGRKQHPSFSPNSHFSFSPQGNGSSAHGSAHLTVAHGSVVVFGPPTRLFPSSNSRSSVEDVYLRGHNRTTKKLIFAITMINRPIKQHFICVPFINLFFLVMRSVLMFLNHHRSLYLRTDSVLIRQHVMSIVNFSSVHLSENKNRNIFCRKSKYLANTNYDYGERNLCFG